MAEKHIKTYPNGATLIYYRQNINSATDVTMGFLCGARCDGEKKGLAHALEHSMIVNNGAGDLDEKELYQLFRNTGTVQGAFTGWDMIMSTFNTPNKNFEKIFKINCEFFLKKDYSENRWRRERKAILQELYMSLDEDGISAIEANRSGKPLNRILGDAHTLNMITTKDFVDYAKKRFISNNMIISVVTSLPYNDVKKIVEDNFINKFPTDWKKTINVKVEGFDLKDELDVIDKPNTNSFHIEFLFKGLDGVEKNDLMSRFEEWYFNDFAGKMYQKLRYENPLVYAANFVSAPVLNSNLKAFEIKTSPENVHKCVEVMAKILREAIKKGVSEEDFELFKQSMLEERARKTNIKTYRSKKLLEDYIYGKKPFVRNFFNKLMNLNREDVNSYLKQVYGKSNLSVTYVGDVNKAEGKVFDERTGLPIDRNYPVMVVSDEKIVQDYLKYNPLYTLDDILTLFRYWDEYQIELLKYNMDQQYKETYIDLKTPRTYKVPKISQSKVIKAYAKTAMENARKEKEKESNEEKVQEEVKEKVL